MRLKRRPFKAVPVDIAPLIDIVFLLLLFFMLTSSFVIYPGIRVTLPKATSSRETSASSIVITLTKDHLIYIDDEVVSYKRLGRVLRSVSSGTPVLIRADRHAYVDKLVSLWDECRQAGLTQVHIATLSE